MDTGSVNVVCMYISFPDPSPLRPPIMKREREGSGR